jgi:hypothetical protein
MDGDKQVVKNTQTNFRLCLTYTRLFFVALCQTDTHTAQGVGHGREVVVEVVAQEIGSCRSLTPNLNYFDNA